LEKEKCKKTFIHLVDVIVGIDVVVVDDDDNNNNDDDDVVVVVSER
jgi:hypothetical protein